MADMTKGQKQALVKEALQDHIPWEGEGADTRTLRQLRTLFERRHLGGLVRTYQAQKAVRSQPPLDIADIDRA